MTNNPRKIVGLEGYGLKITEQVPLEVPSCDTNIRYLRTKKDRMGHTLTLGGTASRQAAKEPSADLDRVDGAADR